jgi:predicted protein tyrosine phosphatase
MPRAGISAAESCSAAICSKCDGSLGPDRACRKWIHHAGDPQNPEERSISGTENPVPTIEVASRIEAGEILGSRERCAGVKYLVSIGDSQDPLPAGYDTIVRKLRLLIADVVTEFGATEEDIVQIIRLAESLRSATGTVLIHCEAGISRSTAAALIMYAYWLGPGREPEAMGRVLSQRPVAIPNRRMVELADRILDRGGRLLEALPNKPLHPSAPPEHCGDST